MHTFHFINISVLLAILLHKAGNIWNWPDLYDYHKVRVIFLVAFCTVLCWIRQKSLFYRFYKTNIAFSALLVFNHPQESQEYYASQVQYEQQRFRLQHIQGMELHTVFPLWYCKNRYSNWYSRSHYSIDSGCSSVRKQICSSHSAYALNKKCSWGIKYVVISPGQRLDWINYIHF